MNVVIALDYVFCREFALSQSRTGVWRRRKLFGIVYVIRCILMQSGGSYV